MNEVQATRLLRVADALRDANRHNWPFDMSTWGYRRFGYMEPESLRNWTEQHRCGTPACALGHYAARVDLQTGFKLAGQEVRVRNTRGDKRKFRPLWEAVDSVIKYFGLAGGDEFEQLFGSEGCGDAKKAIAAAKYIEKFVRNKGFKVEGRYVPTELV